MYCIVKRKINCEYQVKNMFNNVIHSKHNDLTRAKIIKNKLIDLYDKCLEENMVIHYTSNIKKIPFTTLRKILQESYKPKETIDDFVLDKDLSIDNKVCVYTNNDYVVIVHNSNALHDWMNKIDSDVLNDMKEIQKKTLEKYKNKNITTIGYVIQSCDNYSKNSNVILLKKLVIPLVSPYN